MKAILGDAGNLKMPGLDRCAATSYSKVARVHDDGNPRGLIFFARAHIMVLPFPSSGIHDNRHRARYTFINNGYEG